MGSVSRSQSSSSGPSINSCEDESVCVQFWMNGCSQVAHVSRSGLGRYRRDLLATGAVLLN